MLNGSCHFDRIIGSNQDTSTIGDKLGSSTCGGSNNGRPAGHRFQNRESKPFCLGTKQPGIAFCVKLAEFCLRWPQMEFSAWWQGELWSHLVASEDDQPQLGKSPGCNPKCLQSDVTSLPGRTCVDKADRRDSILPTWRRPELLMIDAVGYKRHIRVAIICLGDSRKPPRDYDFVQRHSPSCIRSLNR